MNIKKMFASLTGVLMLATAVVPVSLVGAANYSEELQGAYTYAFDRGITTMTSIDNANMYGELTRGQLAKMIANWAEKELGKKADETAACVFTDANTAEGDLAGYLKKACQMGLMGQGIEAFRPNEKVTRGEFGTTLSRAIWGDKYNTTEVPFYKNHLAALKDAKIMNMIENPSQPEIRGYVMLMLQRATTTITPSECKDPAVILACALNADTCPAACKDIVKDSEVSTGVVKAGDLVVTATAAPERKVVIGGAISDLDTINFKADQSVTLDKIVLERYGFSTATDVEEVWLENEDGVIIADARSLNSKDEVTLSFKKDYKTFDKAATATVVLKTSADAKVGGTIGFKVKSVTSSAKNTNLAQYTPYTYDMVNYSAVNVTLATKGSNRIYNYAPEQSYEMARLQLKSAEAPLLVNGITLTNKGTVDMDKFLDKVQVLANGQAVKNLKYSVNRDDQLVLSFDTMEVAIRERVTFVVNVSLKDFDDYGKNVKYVVAEESDFKATEKKTGVRVSPTLSNEADYPVYTINGGKIKLSNTKLGTVDAAQGSENVLIGQGELSLGESVKINSFKISAFNTTNGNVAYNDIDAVTLVVGADEYDGKKNGNEFTFNNVILEKSGKIELRVDILDTAVEGKTVQFKIDGVTSFGKAAFANAKYEITREVVNQDDVSGSIIFENLRVQPAKGSLENTLTKKVEFLTNETSRKTVFDGTYTAKKNPVTINKFMVTKGADGKVIDGDVNFYLFVDGKEVSDTNRLGIEGFFSDVAVAAGQSVKVRVEAEIYSTQKGDYLYGIEINGEDDNGNEVKASADLTKIGLTENGSVSLSTSAAAKDTVLLGESNTVVAEFIVKPSNGQTNLRLDSFVLEATGPAGAITADDLKVTVAGDEQDAVSGLKYEPVVSLPTEGVVVKVTLKPETYGNVTLKVAELNGATQTRTFKKQFVKALVKIASQEERGGITRFTLNVETNDSANTVKDLKLVSGKEEFLLNGEFVDGDYIEVANTDVVRWIDTISYTIMPDSAPVSIAKSDYNDFFKVGTSSDYARVFNNK